MRNRLTTGLDVALTVVVFAAFLPLLLALSLGLALQWAFRVSRELVQAALGLRR